MACLTIHFFTDTAKKQQPAALLMQNGCSFQGKVGMVQKFMSSFRNYNSMRIIGGSSGNNRTVQQCRIEVHFGAY